MSYKSSLAGMWGISGLIFIATGDFHQTELREVSTQQTGILTGGFKCS